MVLIGSNDYSDMLPVVEKKKRSNYGWMDPEQHRLLFSSGGLIVLVAYSGKSQWARKFKNSPGNKTREIK